MEIGNQVSDMLYDKGQVFLFEVLRPLTIHKMDLSLRVYINERIWQPVENSVIFNYEIR